MRVGEAEIGIDRKEVELAGSDFPQPLLIFRLGKMSAQQLFFAIGNHFNGNTAIRKGSSIFGSTIVPSSRFSSPVFAMK